MDLEKRASVEAAVAHLEAAELEHVHLQPLDCAHLLVLLLTLDDVPAAKALWMRTSRTTFDCAPALFSALRGILEASAASDYMGIHAALAAFLAAPAAPAPLVAAVGDLQAAVRARTLDLLPRAYHTIALGTAAEYLGLPVPETRALVTGRGWEVLPADPGAPGPYLVPHSPPAVIDRSADPRSVPHLANLLLHLQR